MTFSIVGRSPDGSQLGVAVASKFLAVGAFVPAAAVGAGAVATQADAHLGLKAEGLRRMAGGERAADALAAFLAEDDGRAARQAGLVDAWGTAVSYTGAECLDWAGGLTGEGDEGSFAAQGNILAGPEVVDAMAQSWRASRKEPHLARRLLSALAAGDAMGGDRRGRQSAALLVVAPAGGYGGTSDVVVDLRVDDGADPVSALGGLLELHELYFGVTAESDLIPLQGEVLVEVSDLLGRVGAPGGPSRGSVTTTAEEVEARLALWMDQENFEERRRVGCVDPVVLEYLRRLALRC